VNKIGVLALQGCIDPHLKILEKCGVTPLKVRSIEELGACDGLILPGGESSTMLKIIERNSLTHALTQFIANKPVWGICAGAILLAEDVHKPSQFSFKKIKVRATRNHYGSQLDSFKAEIEIPLLSHKMTLDFIRAPHLERLSDDVQVLATHNNDQVILRDKDCLLSSCHPELGDDYRLHSYFIDIVNRQI